MSERKSFFNRVAPKWNQFCPPEKQVQVINRGLDLIGNFSGFDIADIGCGTGILAHHILERLGKGRLLAVDFAEEMIAIAKNTYANDSRVAWICKDIDANAQNVFTNSSIDVLFCYNTFPHFPNQQKTLESFYSWLKPGGKALIWHDASRHKINEVHGRESPPISFDILLPVDELAEICRAVGFSVELAHEDDKSYTLFFTKPQIASKT